MNNWILVLGYLISFGVAALLVPAIRRVALKNGWIDRPDGDRKVHRVPIPTIGGLGIAGGFGAGLLFLLSMQQIVNLDLYLPPPALWMGALLILGTGLYDDIYGLDFRSKFVVQFIAGYVLLWAGYRVNVEELMLIELTPYQEALYSIPLTLLWTVAVINAVNLIDGLDGLAAGVAMIAFGGLALMFDWHGEAGVAILAGLMIPALAGFLIHNFNPASIFMGDSGSLFLGYMLAAYTLQGDVHTNGLIGQIALVVVLGFPVLDTGLAFVRRWISGNGIFAADHDHIHHRLAQMWSQQKAVFVLYAVELGFAAAAVAMSRMTPLMAVAMLGVVVVATLAGLSILGYPVSIAIAWRRRASAEPVRQASATREEPAAKETRPREVLPESPVWLSPSSNHISIDHLPHQERNEPSEAEQTVK